MPLTAEWRQYGMSVLMTALAIVATTECVASQPAPLSGPARPIIERFLLTQTAGLPGRVAIAIDTPASGPLPPCEAPEPFLPAGARPWGRVSVGVRCNMAPPWTRYVPAYIAVVANYYVASRTINAGETLTPPDFTEREGDLAALPRKLITNPAQLNGMVAMNRIASGAPLRLEALRGAVVAKQGQTVKVVTRGDGFTASTEGKTMSQAIVGTVVQVKISSGQIINGTVLGDGTIEVQK
jgi:flagellar basal body P-ring formation protein FlgA